MSFPTTINNASEITPAQLEEINAKMEHSTPEEIIAWSIDTFPGLYQTTAFGLTGLVILDMISKLSKSKNDKKHAIDLVFVDTLHHFKETLELVDRVKEVYPDVKLHVYKPNGADSEKEFAEKYGQNLWETDDNAYDYLVKVEPIQRAYEELNITAVFTGRRRSQGGARGSLPVLELSEGGKLIKINPLANWDFKQVKAYIDANNVPYNSLLDNGYRSVGDYHSTVPVKEGEDERAGRWKGREKNECGIHETSRFGQYLAERARAAKTASRANK